MTEELANRIKWHANMADLWAAIRAGDDAKRLRCYDALGYQPTNDQVNQWAETDEGRQFIAQMEQRDRVSQ